MEDSTRPDRCPFISVHAMSSCRAHHAVSFEPVDAFGRRLPAALTCSFLAVGTAAPGRFYPRCAIGDDSARVEFVERRRQELNAQVEAALLAADASANGEAGVMVADDEGRYLAVNAAMCRALGYEREDMLLGKSVWDLTPEPHEGNGRTMWREFVAAGEGFGTYQLTGHDGRVTTFDYIARANVIPGLHVSILTPQASRPSTGNEPA